MMAVRKKIIVMYLVFMILGSPVAFSQKWYKSKVIVVENSAQMPLESDMGLQGTLVDDKNQKQMEKQKMINFLAQQTKKLTLAILSGQIYGYNFEYTPSDTLRGVDEKWKLELVSSIADDDKKLSVYKAGLEKQSFYAIYRYDLSPAQLQRLEAWEIADIHPSAGRGFSSLNNFDVLESKLVALSDAIRDGVRSRLRLEIPNKPKSVKGIVKLTDTPFFFQSGNYFNSEVKIDIRTDSIDVYELF